MKENKEFMVFIEYQFRTGPFGGANQFLCNLKEYFEHRNCYTENIAEATHVLINHTYITKETLEMKHKFPDKVFIHRVDGPVSKHRKFGKVLDKQAFYLDKLICSGTIFQSTWTKESCFAMGFEQGGMTTVIHNAPKSGVFERSKNKERSGKVKLITTSWSPNWNKGFDLLVFLDQHLDFTKYELTFIGRSPVEFQNIHHIDAMPPNKMAEILRKQDIYLAVSKAESCSNSLIEAMNCGLAVVGRDSGCYPELIQAGGVIFKKEADLLDSIRQVSEKLAVYSEKLPYYHMDEIGKQYEEFMRQASGSKKALTRGGMLRWNCYEVFVKIYRKVTDKYVRIKEKMKCS